MKRTISSLIFALSLFVAVGQAPNAFKFQAIARDSSSKIISNQEVAIRISIITGEISNSPVYTETHFVKTNLQGLINLEVGKGNPQTGIFSGINWGSGASFIRLEIDPKGGSEYIIAGTSQLLSVPYALYAGKSARAEIADSTQMAYFAKTAYSSKIAEAAKSADSAKMAVTANMAITAKTADTAKIAANVKWAMNAGKLYYNDGNVGIGTNSPLYKLHVKNENGNSLLRVESGSLQSGIQIVSSGNYVPFLNFSSTSYNGAGAVLYFDAANKLLKLRTSPTNETSRELVLKENGDLGIGTNSPKTKVEVQDGDVYINNATNGIILKSPDGQCWRVTIDNTGNFVKTAITCP